MWLDFGLQKAPMRQVSTREIATQGCPRSSWRRCSDFLSVLASFWDPFGSILAPFWLILAPFFVDSGVDVWAMFDCSGPFRSLVGSIPSSFHAFVLPFLPPVMHLFVPPSFHRCFPLSLVPFRIWVLAFLWHVRRSPFPQRPSTVLHFFVYLFLHRLAHTILARRPARSD